jgi:hypothetical protein
LLASFTNTIKSISILSEEVRGVHRDKKYSHPGYETPLRILKENHIEYSKEDLVHLKKEEQNLRGMSDVQTRSKRRKRAV